MFNVDIDAVDNVNVAVAVHVAIVVLSVYVSLSGHRARAEERAQLLQAVPRVPLQAQVCRGHLGPVPRPRAEAQVQAGT